MGAHMEMWSHGKYFVKLVATSLLVASWNMPYSSNIQVRSQRSVGTNSGDTCCLSYLYCTQKMISEIQFWPSYLTHSVQFPWQIEVQWTPEVD